MSVLFCEMRNCIFILLFMMLHNSVHGTISYGRRNRADGFIRDTRIAYACQDSTMNLSCTSSNGVIRIIRANYGRFVLSTCNPWSVTSGWDLQCSARESFTIVAERCDWKPECSIVASQELFGDPCRTTFKYIEVLFHCIEATTTSTTTTTTSTTTTTTTEPTEVTTSGCDCYIRGTTTCDVSSRECQCRESYTGTKCDRCAKGYFNFPECTKCECDSSGTLPDVCSTETGVCLCGPNLTPTCDQCLPGFVNYPFCQEDIATKAPSTVEPTDDSPQSLKLSSITPTTTTMSPNGNRYTCMPEKANGIWWPESMPGIVERDCPEPYKGKMTWKCTNKGWKRKPNLSNCVSPWLDNLEDLLSEGKRKKNGTANKCKHKPCPPIEASPNVEEVASTLHDRTSNTIFSAGDLKLTSLNLFPKLNRHFRTQVANFTRHQRKIKVKQFSESVLKTGSNLLRHPDSWKTLPTRERTVVATSLVVNMEETAFQIADSLDVGDPNFISRDTNIFMEINAVKVEEVEERKLNFPSSSVDHTGDRVTIPLQSLKTSISEDELRIVFLVYKNLAEFMSPVMEGAVDSELLPTNEPASNETQPYISTNIFSASVNGRTTKIELSQPLLFTLKHNQVSSSEFKPVCSYWHFNETLAGHWSSDGCKLVQTNSSHTTCQCDHMTNFAVLMDVVGTKLSIEEQTSLTAITYFGCIVSITCLLCCLFTFCFFKNLQCDRNTIHKNLCLMLMLAEVVFIVGINLTQYKILCAVVAGLLHFLFLAAFSWMCLEGVQLYVMLIEVFEAERSRRLWYYLFGYGVPVVIVAVSAGVHHEGYGTENHCWLNTENYFIWSFVGPVVAVLAVNIVMLGIAVYMMCRHANTLASSLKAKEKTRLQKISGEPNSGSSSGSSAVKDKSHLNPEIPSWLKGAVVLVVLLGLTWSFGVMFVSKESVVMAYLFTILNTLQGVFIFVFHCVMNEKVKKEYKKFAYRATWLPGCIRNILTGYSGSLATSPHNSSSSGGVLLKFWSGRRRRKSSTSTAVDKSSSKGKKRRSDLRSSEVESFSNSNSNHGPIYRPPSNNNGYTHGYLYTNNATGGGIVGDLSVADCSVIDSEYVTEYLHNHMKVSMEKTAYSSDSEEECAEENIEHKNRLSILSEDSAVKNSDFVSTEAELSYSEMSEDESDKSKTLAAEMKPLFSKTYSEKNLLNNLVNSVDVEQKKCPSSNELRLVNITADSMTRSTPNMKLIEGYESILNSADVLFIENEDEATKGRKSVTRMSSDCPVKSNPHRYVLDYSEC